MRNILLLTIGSLGNLHPFIAIGLELQRRGHSVVLAVPEDHVAKVCAAGLDGQAIMPSFETIRQQMGVEGQEAVIRIMNDQAYLMEKILMPSIADSVTALDPLMEKADVVISSLFAFAAPIAAEKHKVPLVNVVLQPMTLFSQVDPPRTPEFRMLAGPQPGGTGRVWNRLIYRLLRMMLRHRYALRINAIRRQHGLAHSSDALFLDAGGRAALSLCCYSPELSPKPADAPPRTIVTGFPFFDSESGTAKSCDPALAAFLNSGPPPLIFTLGSFAVFAPGNFYSIAEKVARTMGMRAVLLTGETSGELCDAMIFRCAYAPHSQIFPCAAAIVHHGGIGTTGQALRAGKPQIIVPHMGDQFDNGARIAKLGVGRVVTAKAFTPEKVVPVLKGLLTNEQCLETGRRVAALIALEDGAGCAASLIEKAMSTE